MRGAAKASEALVSPPPEPSEGSQQVHLRHHGHQSMCGLNVTPASPSVSPSAFTLPRGQAQSYLSFLALTTSSSQTIPEAKGSVVLPIGRAAQPASRCTKNQGGSSLSRQSGLHGSELAGAPSAHSDEPAAPGSGLPMQRLPKHRRGPPTISAEEANRRVRFWWSRGSRQVGAAARAAAAGAGKGPLQEPAGLDKPQRPVCLAQAAAALGASSPPQGKRAKVTFAPQGLRLPLSARRACSSCIKTRIQQQRPTGEATAAAAAAAAAVSANSGISGGPSPAAARQLLPTSSLGGPVSENAARRAPPARPPSSRPQQLQQPLHVHKQLRDEDAPTVEFSSSQSREGRQGLPPTSLDTPVEPLAAEGASLAATRAAAVAKAAAAVAAAAQAEVEAAAAAAAAWGGTGEYKASSNGLSTEQRREQLMLVLRLLLLLPPELQHAVQARLFMLQQQRQRVSPIRGSPLSKRAATTTNLHMTLSASGSLKTPWKPLQPQRRDGEAAAASTSLPGGLSADLRKSSSSHSSSSHSSGSHSSNSSSCCSNSSAGRTSSTIISSGIQQQHDEQHVHLQHTASESTVNGLFMSATLQASAVLQLTPGRPATDAAAAGALAGGSAAHIPASGRLSGCRCRSGAAACHRPLASLPSHGRNPTLQQQQQQQQQHAQLVLHPPTEDHCAGCLVRSQQQHQETQPPEGRGVLGRSSLGPPPQASICRMHVASVQSKAEALWMTESVPCGAASTGPPPSGLGGCMRCGGAAPAAASSGNSCSCTSSRAGAQGQTGCLLPHAKGAITSSRAAQRKGSQLPCCATSASQSTASKVGGPAAASTAADRCRGIIKNSCATCSSATAQMQQQAARDDEAVAVAPSSGVAGGPQIEPCSCGDGVSAASAWERRKLRGMGGQQQGTRQDVCSLQPARVLGLNFRPCSSGCNIRGSRRRWNQELLQLHLASLPSLLRAESTGELRSTAAELRALTASHARLMIASRSIERGPPQRTLAITLHTSASNGGNTESCSSATSNSVSAASHSKEACEIIVLSEEEEENGLSNCYSQRQQKRDSSEADTGAAGDAASALSRVWIERGEEGAHPRMLLPVEFEGPPSFPEGESLSSPGGPSSSALTMEAPSSPRLSRAESLVDLVEVAGEEEAGWTTAAWRWGLRPTPPSDDLHASFMYGFPSLPEATNLSSSTSLRGPTSLFFCPNDPRGYKGPLVRSAAVISVGALSASAIRTPFKGGNPIAFSAGSACGKAFCREASPPIVQLNVLSVNGTISSQSECAVRMQEQQRRHPSSCPNLQHDTHQRTSSAEKLLGGVVCSVAWRSTDVTDILDFKRKAGGAILPLGCLQATSRFRSHKALCYSTSRHDSKILGPLFTKEPLQCASPPDIPSDYEEASPIAAAFKSSPALTRVSCTEDEYPLSVEMPNSRREEKFWGGEEHEESHALVAEAASEVRTSPPSIRADAATTEAPVQSAGPLVKAMAKALESSERQSLSSSAGKRMPLCSPNSHSRLPTTAMDEGAQRLPGSQCIPSRLTAASEACSATAEITTTTKGASPERQQNPSFCAPRPASVQSSEVDYGPLRNEQSSERYEAEEKEPKRGLFTPSRLCAYLGLDADHSLSEGLDDILQAAARAQQELSAKHQEELQALRAAAAQVKADPTTFPRVLPLYVEALQRRCHSALQRTLKARRAAASLQLAEEERLQLLHRLQSELPRTCPSPQAECASPSVKSAAMSLSQELANPVPVSASLAEPDAGLSMAPSSPSEEGESPSAFTSATVELRLPAVPRLLSLRDESCLDKHFGALRRLTSAPRLARLSGQDRAEPPCLRSLSNAPRSSSAAGGPTAGPAGNVRLTGFESTAEFKSEVSFLKQLQKDFAASKASARSNARDYSTTGFDTHLPLQQKIVQLCSACRARMPLLRLSADGSAVTLEQFVLQQREEALRELPREMVNQSLDLSPGSSAAPLHVEEPCTADQVASRLQTLKTNPLKGIHPSGVSVAETSAQGECQFADALLSSWHDRVQQLEIMMEDDVDALARLCTDSLERVKQMFQRIMPVRVVRL